MYIVLYMYCTVENIPVCTLLPSGEKQGKIPCFFSQQQSGSKAFKLSNYICFVENIAFQTIERRKHWQCI